MLKMGLIEQPLHTRYVPAALIGLGYLTAIGTGADSYWVPDHINSLFPPAVMTAKYVGTARLVSDIEAHYDPWTVLGHLVARNRWGRRRLGIGVTDTGRRNPAVIARRPPHCICSRADGRSSESGRAHERVTNPTAWTGQSRWRASKKPSRPFERCGIPAANWLPGTRHSSRCTTRRSGCLPIEGRGRGCGLRPTDRVCCA